MNSFTTTITADGFEEKLVYNGKTYIKRYKRDGGGWRGQDKGWDYEDLPEEVIEALEERDELEIMDALEA